MAGSAVLFQPEMADHDNPVPGGDAEHGEEPGQRAKRDRAEASPRADQAAD